MIYLQAFFRFLKQYDVVACKNYKPITIDLENNENIIY